MKSALRIATGFLAAGLLTVCAGCPKDATTTTDKKVTTKTEVNDKLLGGTEVKKTTVIEDGDKSRVREEKTELNEDGTKKKTTVTEKGDLPRP